MKNITYRNIEPEDYTAAIKLATTVHGEGYIDDEIISRWVNKGIKNNINTGYVAYHENQLVGFRLTYAVEQWQIDSWCSPALWQVEANKVCYFKCNTDDENYRGHGIGGQLLKLSIDAAKQQGAIAGVSHLWRQSPAKTGSGV